MDVLQIIMKLRVNGGRESALQLRRVAVDSDRGHTYWGIYVGEVSEQCAVCKSFDTSPRVPVAGTSTVSTINEMSQVDRRSLGDLIALHTLGVFP